MCALSLGRVLPILVALLMTAVCPAAHGGSRPRTDAYGDPLPGGALARIGVGEVNTAIR